ncbi:MAG: right-handed parallel beta-helix repeat-containing protein [Ilumatobacteraceae bacterium]
MRRSLLIIPLVAANVLAVGVALSPPAGAATYDVCASTCTYSSIQTAIDNAASYDTITVAPETFTEAVTIDLPLTLEGAQVGVDPSTSGRAGGESVISNQYAVTIASDDVVLDGFEIVDARQAVRVSGTFDNIQVSHNWIHQPSTSDDQLMGILLAADQLSDVRISDNIVHTEATADSLAAIALGSVDVPTTVPTITDLQITGNDIGWSTYGLFDGADPTTYVIETMALSGNWFHDNESAFNLGNIHNGLMSGNVVEDTGGTIGIDTGSISGNSFVGGGRLGLWGTQTGDEFWQPSADLDIVNNWFTDEVVGRAITVGVGIDASTIVVRANAFLDSGIAVGSDINDAWAGYLVRNLGTGSLDATLNWWDDSTGLIGNTGSTLGTVDTDPWIASFDDDPEHLAPTDFPLADLALTRAVGFWPLVDTATVITSSTPDPTFVGNSVTVAGTVEITGLGGDTSGITSLGGRVDAGNGTNSCSDSTLTGTVTNLLFDFSCAFLTTAPSSTAVSADYTDTSPVPFYGTSSDDQAHDVYSIENLDITFNGEYFDADGLGTTRLSATIDGGTAMCESGVEVTFTLTPVVGSPIITTATTGLDGTASTTATVAVGVYDVTVKATDTEGCIYTDGLGTLVVFNKDAATAGGGWYKVDASPPRVNFGYTVQVKVNRRLDQTTVSGQLLWTHQATSRLKGTVSGYYVPVACPTVDSLSFSRCARFSGTGTLYDYNPETERWINPRTVTFEVWVADGGQSSMAKRGGPKQAKPDAFGITITGETVGGESAPIQLNGGNLQIR